MTKARSNANHGDGIAASEITSGTLAIEQGGTNSTNSAAAATALGLGTANSPSFAGMTLGTNSETESLTTVLYTQLGWVWRKIANNVQVDAVANYSGTATLVSNYFALREDTAGFIYIRGQTSLHHTVNLAFWSFSVAPYGSASLRTINLSEVSWTGAEGSNIGGQIQLTNSFDDLVIEVDWTGGTEATTGKVDAWEVIVPSGVY
jgi:hypothetical protein